MRCSVSRGLPLLSPPRWEPSLSFPKSHTHPSPYPRVHVLPSAGLPPLTSHRHSRHCRPRTESSLPRGCPAGETRQQLETITFLPQESGPHTPLWKGVQEVASASIPRSINNKQSDWNSASEFTRSLQGEHQCLEVSG